VIRRDATPDWRRRRQDAEAMPLADPFDDADDDDALPLNEPW
jgi:hypothetical protein